MTAECGRCIACQIGAPIACADTERTIRRDERRLIAGELRAWSRDLAWHVDHHKVTTRLAQLLADAADQIEGAA